MSPHKLYLLEDKPENRRYIGKYLDVYQYPNGTIEIKAAGTVLPYSTYDKLGTIDQGQIVENKRLGQVLQMAQIVQANRDSRSVAGPSTAHRANGAHIRRTKVSGSKTQRQLGQEDLRAAIKSRS